MKPIRSLVGATAVALSAVACSNLGTPAPSSSWRVDPARSSIHFVSTKAGIAGVGGVSEVNRFTRVAGGMDPKGGVSLDVDLSSVDTGVSIRDERIRTLLFNAAAGPTATFVAQLDPAILGALPPHAARDIDLQGSLTLAGQTKPMAAKLHLSRGADGTLLVRTRAPILVDLQHFGLKPGVEALRAIVGLNFLASSAPVSFALTLKPQG